MFVSVIIPTYNRAATIRRSIESVLEQTYDKLEVIVVDDGSEDESGEIIRGIADDRLRYIQLKENGGVSKARNYGVSLAEYELIAFQDSDDVWRPDKLEKQIKLFEKYPDSAMVYCAYEFHNNETVYRVPSEKYPKEILDGEIYPYLLQNNSIGAPTLLMRKTCFESIGGFDTAYPALEDWDLALKAAKAGRISFADEVLLDAYRYGEGVSSSYINRYKARCRMIAEYMEDMQKYGIFDRVIADLFADAEKNEVLEYVKNTLILALAEKKGV